MDESTRDNTFSVSEAARIAGMGASTIRRKAQSGEIHAENVDGEWRLDKASFHEWREERRARNPEPPSATPDFLALADRIEELAKEAGRAEGRREITERTESSLREDLERERRRNEELQDEIRSLRDDLDSRGFWSRLFGS